MIEGLVNAAYEPVVPLIVRGPTGETREVDAVIDAAFNRFLTLSPTLVTELALPFIGVSRVVLAHGSEETLDMDDVTVLWDGQPPDVDAFVADATCLVGVFLLDGHVLQAPVQMQVRDGGRVVIEADE